MLLEVTWTKQLARSSERRVDMVSIFALPGGKIVIFSATLEFFKIQLEIVTKLPGVRAPRG